MIIVIAVVGGILGLANLLLPRSLMLFGQRWTLRDGARAEPSDLYVLWVRVSGAIILIATVVITVGLAWAEHERARKAELEELWDVHLYPGDEIEVITDPFIVTSEATGERQVVLAPTGTAVVGRDEFGDLGVSSFDDGDLLVGMGYSACTFRHLIVTRDGDETTVGIVVELPEIPDLPGLQPPAASPDATPSPAETFQNYDFCTRRFVNGDDPVGLTVFRVPGGG